MLSTCLCCIPRAGDPIEVGAASAVLKGGASGLRMTAAKSHMGHAEPAAGAVGILQVRLRIMQQTFSGKLHPDMVHCELHRDFCLSKVRCAGFKQALTVCELRRRQRCCRLRIRCRKSV